MQANLHAVTAFYMSKVSHCLSLRRKFFGFEMPMHWQPLMFTRVTGLQYTAILIDMCNTDVTVVKKFCMFLKYLQEKELLGRSETCTAIMMH
jgi:hypothetical protein